MPSVSIHRAIGTVVNGQVRPTPEFVRAMNEMRGDGAAAAVTAGDGFAPVGAWQPAQVDFGPVDTPDAPLSDYTPV